MNSSSSPDLMRLSEEIEHLRQSLSDGQKIERGQMLRTIILRSVVGGILIAAGALIVYPPIKDVVVAKGDRAQIIADIAKFDADLQKRKNDERERELRIENERIREDLNDLLVKETDLKQVLETRSKEYRRLSEQYGTVAAKFDSLAEKYKVTAEEKEALEALAQITQTQIGTLVQALEDEKKTSDSRALQLQEKINTREIRGLRVKVWWDGGRKNESIARKVESLLTNLGADVDLQREILSFNSDPPYIRMRPESIGAQQIMNFLEEKLKITFDVSVSVHRLYPALL